MRAFYEPKLIQFMEELQTVTNTTLEGNAFATKSASWIFIRIIIDTAYI
jgi:hypothetical protein